MAQSDAYVNGALDHGAPPRDDPSIIPRDIRFGISANPTRYWNGGDPIRTLMVDGLSIFLPEGERFFIRSLKYYAASIDDRSLARDFQDFAVQEAYHTREHEDYNRAMAALGYDVNRMEEPVRLALGAIKRPLFRLAITCAIEHLTATFARSTLRRPEIFTGADPRYRRLWMWHALEELEHKSVALDVFRFAAKDIPRWQGYLLRVSAMNSTVVPFLIIYLRNAAMFARRDGLKTGPRFWARFAYASFVAPGPWTFSMWSFLRYYRPGFDPHKYDDSKLIAQARDWLAQDLRESESATPAPAH